MLIKCNKDELKKRCVERIENINKEKESIEKRIDSEREFYQEKIDKIDDELPGLRKQLDTVNDRLSGLHEQSQAMVDSIIVFFLRRNTIIEVELEIEKLEKDRHDLAIGLGRLEEDRRNLCSNLDYHFCGLDEEEIRLTGVIRTCECAEDITMDDSVDYNDYNYCNDSDDRFIIPLIKGYLK